MSTTRDDTNIRDGTDMAPQERTAVTALLNDDVVFRVCYESVVPVIIRYHHTMPLTMTLMVY